MKTSKGEWKLAEITRMTEEDLDIAFVGEVDPKTGKARGKTLPFDSPFIREVQGTHSMTLSRAAILKEAGKPLEFWRRQIEVGSLLEMQASSGEWKLAEVAKIDGDDNIDLVFVGEIDPTTNQPRGKRLKRNSEYLRELGRLATAQQAGQANAETVKIPSLSLGRDGGTGSQSLSLARREISAEKNDGNGTASESLSGSQSLALQSNILRQQKQDEDEEWRRTLENGTILEMQNSKGEWLLAKITRMCDFLPGTQMTV
jgi:hypothetical protein